MKKSIFESEQVRYAKELMKKKNIRILDIDWNKFKSKKEINDFINCLNDTIDNFINEENKNFE